MKYRVTIAELLAPTENNYRNTRDVYQQEFEDIDINEIARFLNRDKNDGPTLAKVEIDPVTGHASIVKAPK